jgi:hypothetical protein
MGLRPIIDTSTILARCKGMRKRRSGLSKITKENQMKTAIGIVLVSAMLIFSGCQTTPQQAAPAAQGPPGPAGPQGDQGQTGQQGQTGDAGHRHDRGHPGEQGYRGDTGYKGDTGHQGKAAPCPAGQHRHTNPDSGRVYCVSD